MEGYLQKMQANIWKLYVLHAVRGSLVHVAVLVIFLASNGLDLQQVFILEALWSVLQMGFEIPSGYLSDRWGRKPTLVLGAILKSIGMLIYCLSFNFSGFLLAVVFLSTGSSLFSGTDSAIAYDTLLELGEEDQYRKIAGKQAFFRFCVEAVAGILGGLIALYSLRATLWTTFGFFLIAPIIAITLKEPKRHKLQETRHFAAMWNIFVTSVVHNPAIRGVILLNSILITMAFSLYWFTQPYQEMVGLPLVLFGVTHSIIVLCHAFASRYVHSLEKWFDDRLLLISISICMIVSFLVLGLTSSIWAIAFFFVARIMWGFTTPLTSDILNRMTSSETRATVLSFQAFGFRLLFAIVSPFLGYTADVLSLNQAILISGCIGAVLLVITFFSMSVVWNKIPK
ncbi:MAG: MFS transporter [Candidatus Peribacter sp.]|jgi:MFS family permease|nr:MFS transporter [Candidatus Peribacter sp.]MBT4393381.1 MFS transporter [Candidatus Peribacter sp.]MBT4600780.1 MFS transporter [Candidatus Peribacter sp.]MBT5149174.1 MFS transporter [Candidatus Peribacter sp.]MBT5937991.1 MFS transporter [Candidatus Peribacter sp.]